MFRRSLAACGLILRIDIHTLTQPSPASGRGLLLLQACQPFGFVLGDQGVDNLG